MTQILTLFRVSQMQTAMVLAAPLCTVRTLQMRVLQTDPW